MTFSVDGFYQAVERVRGERGLSQRDVADQAGVSASTITRLGQGKQNDLNTLDLIAKWAGLNLGDFLPRHSDKGISTISQIVTLVHEDVSADPVTRDAVGRAFTAIWELAGRKPHEIDDDYTDSPGHVSAGRLPQAN